MSHNHYERIVMGDGDIARSLTRIAHEIIERNHGGDNICLVGIRTRGVPLARRLQSIISSALGIDVACGTLDITMYRDDLSTQPTRAPLSSELDPDMVDGRTVVLVDDVFFSGRTIRAALEALSSYGRPQSVQLAVLVDRGHRALPIRADYVGKNIPTSLDERVTVQLADIDGIDKVTIEGGDAS